MATILCIEDEQLLREDISEELRMSDHVVIEAENGQIGLAKIIEHRPDLVLSDISIPVMTGRQLLDEITLNHPDLLDIPFVFLTALADKKEVLEGLTLGADDYLTKPIDFDVLMAKVDSIVRKQEILETKKKNEQVKLYKALTAAKPASADTELTTKQSPSTYELSPSFQNNFRQCIAQASGSAGKMHLIGLSKLREKYKDNWDEISGRVMNIAEKTIKNALQPKDAVSRYGDDSFIVLFAGLNKEEGAFKANAIVEDIVKKLLGEESVGDNDLGITVLVKDISEIDGADGGNISEKIGTTLNGNPASTSNAKSADSNEIDPVAFLEPQITLKFFPVWSAQKEAVVSFGVLAERKTPYGTFHGPMVLHGGELDPFVASLDRIIIEKLCHILKSLERNAEKLANIILPIHQENLSNRNEAETRKILEKHRDLLERTAISCELVGITEHASPNRIREAIHVLKEFFPIVYIRFGEATLGTSSFDNIDVDFIGIDFNEILKTSSSLNKTKVFETLAAHAKKLNAKPYIFGINGRTELVSCLASGIRLISGRQVSEVADTPTKMYPLSGKDIL